jgi:hypothetical protein
MSWPPNAGVASSDLFRLMDASTCIAKRLRRTFTNRIATGMNGDRSGWQQDRE